MLRASTQASSAPTASDSAPLTVSISDAWSRSVSMRCAAASTSLRCCSLTASMPARYSRAIFSKRCSNSRLAPAASPRDFRRLISSRDTRNALRASVTLTNNARSSGVSEACSTIFWRAVASTVNSAVDAAK